VALNEVWAAQCSYYEQRAAHASLAVGVSARDRSGWWGPGVDAPTGRAGRANVGRSLV